jgi:Pseudouridine synthase
MERFVMLHPEYKADRMTYAGRLDPMAEGVLIVLCGEKNKERDTYTSLDKDYEFEFVLGVETDTFDVLGKITGTKGGTASIEDVEKVLSKYRGRIVQKYPPFSSKVVNGEPMFALARSGKLAEADIPTHEVEVKSLELIGTTTQTVKDFSHWIKDALRRIEGDFRQTEILNMWEDYLGALSPDQCLTTFKMRVSSGSGFYVRQLVSDIGRDLGVGAVTTAILRTRVGPFLLAESQK